MRQRLNWIVMFGCFVMAGCGPSPGSTYHTASYAWVYFDQVDAKSGGPPSREIALVANGKATLVETQPVKLIEVDGPLAKVEILEGKDKGATGWLNASVLK